MKDSLSSPTNLIQYIRYKIVPINRVLSIVKAIRRGYFHENTTNNNFKDDDLILFLDSLKDTLFVFIEYPYIDKLYRDSFYNYHSSKKQKHERDCIRLSFFSENIKEGDFITGKAKDLQEKFLGFLVVRPLHKPIGRNVISPLAFKHSDFFIRTTRYKVSIKGVRLYVNGFPASSQDSESISCAEVNIWQILEYYGTRYSEYCSILPSKLRMDLNSFKKERSLPTTGLSVEEMSFLIKKGGFANILYLKEKFYDREKENADFFGLLNCYIESGIPLLIALGNGKIFHVVTCIGRELIKEESFNKVLPTILKNGIKAYDFDHVDRKVVVIDDNTPPYQIIDLNKPTAHYNKSIWHSNSIESFIVPLPPKIYLESWNAKVEVLSIIESQSFFNKESTPEIWFRLFLTSSKSLKSHFQKENPSGTNFVLKDIILDLDLPKLTWVVEFSTEKLIKKKKANSLILLDATETSTAKFKSIIMAAVNGQLYLPTKDFSEFKTFSLPLHSFSMFNENLKRFNSKK